MLASQTPQDTSKGDQAESGRTSTKKTLVVVAGLVAIVALAAIDSMTEAVPDIAYQAAAGIALGWLSWKITRSSDNTGIIPGARLMSPSATPSAKSATVNVSGLRMRTKPSLKGEIMGTLAKGTVVDVHRHSSDRKWVLVGTSSARWVGGRKPKYRKGWSSATYLDGLTSTGTGPASGARRKVLAKAQSQIGYVETPNNRTKYGAWFGLDGYAWCAMYVSWVFYHADHALPALRTRKGSPSSTEIREHYKRAGKMVSKPRPGDLVFYKWGTNPAKTADHIGIVESWNRDGRGFKTVEGNTSTADQRNGGMVMRRNRTMYKVVGFANPYND